MKKPKLNEIPEALHTLEDLAGTGSRLEKEKLLKTTRNNRVLYTLLRRASNDERFHVTPDTLCKAEKIDGFEGTVQERWVAFNKLLDDLSARKVTGKKAYHAMRDFLLGCTPMENKWYMRVLERDLGVGVKSKTLEKIWPGMLKSDSSFNKMMKAEKWDSSKVKEPFKLWAEVKMDGLRCVTVIDGSGKVTLYTSGGKVISHLYHITRAIEDLRLTDRMLDGEMVVWNEDHTKTVWTGKRGALSLSKPRKHISETMAKDIEQLVEYHLFDTLPLNKYQEGKSEVPLHKRRKALKKVLSRAPSKCLVLVGKRNVTTDEEVQAYYDQCILQGYEGVIVKKPDGIYKCKRIRDWLKIKPTKDVSGQIVRFEAGKKRHAKVGKEESLKAKQWLSEVGPVIKTKTGYAVRTAEGTGQAVSEVIDKSALTPNLIQRMTIKKSSIHIRMIARLGALIVENEDGDTVRVGGGLSDKLRNEIWDNQNKYKSQWIDYREQDDKGDTGRTRFPEFLKFRVPGEK